MIQHFAMMIQYILIQLKKLKVDIVYGDVSEKSYLFPAKRAKKDFLPVVDCFCCSSCSNWDNLWSGFRFSTVLNLNPCADSISLTTNALKEYFGILYYSIRGWK